MKRCYGTSSYRLHIFSIGHHNRILWTEINWEAGAEFHDASSEVCCWQGTPQWFSFAGSPSRFKYKLTQVRYVKSNLSCRVNKEKERELEMRILLLAMLPVLMLANSGQIALTLWISLSTLLWCGIHCSGFHDATMVTDIPELHRASPLQSTVLGIIGATERCNLNCVIRCKLDEQISIFNRVTKTTFNACHINPAATGSNTYPKYCNNILLRSSGIYSDINPWAYRT